jgi:hypothetical protein
LISAGAALAAALPLAAYPVLVWPEIRALPLLGGAAVVALAVALVLRQMAAVPVAIALLGFELVLALAAVRVEASMTAAIYGTALLVVAELAFVSIQLRSPTSAAPGFYLRYAVTIGAVALSALAINVVATELSGVSVAGSFPLMAVGVGAVVVIIALVVALVWRSDTGRR